MNVLQIFHITDNIYDNGLKNFMFTLDAAYLMWSFLYSPVHSDKFQNVDAPPLMESVEIQIVSHIYVAIRNKENLKVGIKSHENISRLQVTLVLLTALTHCKAIKKPKQSKLRSQETPGYIRNHLPSCNT